MYSLGPIMFEATHDYYVDSDIICNNLIKALATFPLTLKRLVNLQLKLFAIVNKFQFDLIYAQCGI